MGVVRLRVAFTFSEQPTFITTCITTFIDVGAPTHFVWGEMSNYFDFKNNFSPYKLYGANLIHTCLFACTEHLILRVRFLVAMVFVVFRTCRLPTESTAVYYFKYTFMIDIQATGLAWRSNIDFIGCGDYFFIFLLLIF